MLHCDKRMGKKKHTQIINLHSESLNWVTKTNVIYGQFSTLCPGLPSPDACWFLEFLLCWHDNRMHCNAIHMIWNNIQCNILQLKPWNFNINRTSAFIGSNWVEIVSSMISHDTELNQKWIEKFPIKSVLNFWGQKTILRSNFVTIVSMNESSLGCTQ